jgi:thiamine pyrophosphokinase
MKKNLKNLIKSNGTSILILGPLFIPQKTLLSSFKKTKPTLIVLVDRGNHHLKNIPKYARINCISVGDGDSNQNSKLDILLNPKKDFSDLDFVINAISKEKSVLYVSALGFCACYSKSKKEERFDHLLFNLGSFTRLCNKLLVTISLDERFIFLPKGKHSLEHFGTFSLISLKDQKIKIKGSVEYKINPWKKVSQLSSLGLSNIAYGKVLIESLHGIIIYKAL